MKTALLILFGIASLAVGIVFLTVAIKRYRRAGRAKRVLSSVQLFTIGVFISVALMFVPIYYTSYDFGDTYSWIRPFLIAVHNTLRVFILDGEFDIIVATVSDQMTAIRVGFSLYAAFLYVIAPIMTLGNVLSLFKNLRDEWRYYWVGNRNRKYYIMSELNQKSIALAKSIRYGEGGKESVIVFAEVFEHNEESDVELLTQARDINAICLKKDVSNLDFIHIKAGVEIFLIGNDESENISQAAKITTELEKSAEDSRKGKAKYNIKVFVFSSKPSASYILDSLKYDKLLDQAAKDGFGDNTFKLRRIDEKRQLIWNTVPEMKLFDIAKRHENKTISVMIVGMGTYGMEFLKMLTWYFQFVGYKIEINIVDKRNAGEVRGMIERQCPDLLKNNGCPTDGQNACYDVKIYEDVDVNTSAIDRLVMTDERIGSTDLAIVTLGDDDLDIEVAVHLRSLFDRVHDAKKNADDVKIYSLVFDDRKSGILGRHNAQGRESTVGSGDDVLKNHKDESYDITFFGDMSSQFSYQNIYNPEQDKVGVARHTDWVNKDTEKTAEQKEKARMAETKKYEQYEYYQLASISSGALYRVGVRSLAASVMIRGEFPVCKECKNEVCDWNECLIRKQSAHMSWCAYVRSVGFVYGSNRHDRAFVHDKLVDWNELSDDDKNKD